MNEFAFTPSNITFIIGLIGVIFTVYQYFKNPQIAGDKKDALLAQQVQWQIEVTERRFKDIQENFNGLLTNQNNHLHTVEVRVEELYKTVCSIEENIVKLSTIIEERIPRQN